MLATDLDTLRYPIGTYDKSLPLTDEQLQQHIAHLSLLPAQLQQAVAGLSEQQLDTPYRPGGWTVRQLVHHIADSHLNAYTRFKLALTEDEPTIKPYEEARWAELPDSALPLAVSLQLLTALHERWVYLLRALTPAQLERAFLHPESGRTALRTAVGLYSWHSRHHLAHITRLRERMGW